ncbi:MAG: DUF4262 domain-containing protein [Thermoflexibacter sp.]|jgi:hypothetical protein|nr:DUF4262 domain-containing protein [Thermoflexibacter sp.]
MTKSEQKTIDNIKEYGIVYPTTKGIFPWEADFPKTLKQPILNERFTIPI